MNPRHAQHQPLFVTKVYLYYSPCSQLINCINQIIPMRGKMPRLRGKRMI